MGLREDRRQGGRGEGKAGGREGGKEVRKSANLKACPSANFSFSLIIILTSVFIMLTLNISSAAIFFSFKQRSHTAQTGIPLNYVSEGDL